MKVKTSELIGLALDWAVAKCEGYTWIPMPGVGVWLTPRVGYLHDDKPLSAFNPSTTWSQGGPLIEREKISTAPGCMFNPEFTQWHAILARADDLEDTHKGDTLLIAAMRCYVASKLGDEVDIPEELK